MAVPGGPAAAFPVGGRLPALAVDVSDGSRLALPSPSAAGGEVLVLNFWASYCAPCRAEAPILSSLHARPDVRVVGLAIEGFPHEQTLRAAQALGIRYPIAECDRPLLEKLRVHAVPTTYVIATDGAIVLSRVGAVSESELLAAIAKAKR